MKKIIFAALVLMSTQAQAGSWSTSCENSSCTASQGAVVIHYSADSSGRVVNRVTGISGLPFSADDFQSQEHALSMSIEKSLSRDKRSSGGLDAGGSVGEGVTGGGKISNDSSSSTGLQRRKSQSVSQSQGGRVSVNHTLGFYLYFAETTSPCFTAPASSLQRYLCAAEALMDEYARDGGESVRGAMYGYLFSHKSASVMPDVDITAKSTADNSEMQAIKYIALTEYPAAADERWNLAYRRYEQLSKNSESFAGLNKSFLKNQADVATLMKPGQTALKLHKQGQGQLALAKFAADSWINFNEHNVAGINSLADRYTLAIAATASDVPALRSAFDSAVKNNDPALSKITVPVDYSKIAAQTAAGLGVLVLGAGAVWFVRDRKKNQVQDEKTE